MQPYKLETKLTDYLPIPREVIAMDLPSTAKLIYGALLDRATLSQKNHYADGSGRVYVIYPTEKLAERFQLSDTAVKRHLKELEQRGFISRQRERKNEPNHIYLRLPKESVGEKGERKCTDKREKMTPVGVRKVTPNNRREQQKNINYYQHGEDESL